MATAKISNLRSLEPEEIELLFSALKYESDRILLQLLLETGRPLDDLREARISDLDRDRGVLRLRRENESDREGGEPDVEEVPLSPELLAAVGDYVGKNPGKTYLFEGRCGRPVGPKWVRCTLLPAAIRSGLEDPRSETDRLES